MSTSWLRPNRNVVRAFVAVCAIAMTQVACGGGHHLAEYPFSSRTLAVVYIAPGSPELLTSYYDLGNSQNPIQAVVRAGADVAREHAKGRALEIATTDLDAGRQVTWDMGAIAARVWPGALRRIISTAGDCGVASKVLSSEF